MAAPGSSPGVSPAPPRLYRDEPPKDVDARDTSASYARLRRAMRGHDAVRAADSLIPARVLSGAAQWLLVFALCLLFVPPARADGENDFLAGRSNACQNCSLH